MDAIAVTLAGGGRYIGVAPLGTSLTDEQASQLARIGKNPIVATDADIAGRVAAERDFWILAPYRLDPRHARLPEGSDPADLLALNGPAALTTVLDQARPLGERLIDERLTSLPPEQAQHEAARVLAARPPACWDPGSNTISSRLNVPLPAVRQTLLAHVKEWNIDPRRAAAESPARRQRGQETAGRSGCDPDRSSGGRPWPASSTSDSSDRATGQRWRSSCRGR